GASRGGAYDVARRQIGLRLDQLVELAARSGVDRRGLQVDAQHRELLARVAGAGNLPGPPLALVSRAQRDDAEGAVVRADRRRDRGADHLAAARARWRAQLGLSLRLPARRRLRALGDV